MKNFMKQKPTYDVKIYPNGKKLRLVAMSGSIRVREYETNSLGWANLTGPEMAGRLAKEWGFNLRNVIDNRKS